LNEKYTAENQQQKKKIGLELKQTQTKNNRTKQKVIQIKISAHNTHTNNTHENNIPTHNTQTTHPLKQHTQTQHTHTQHTNIPVIRSGAMKSKVPQNDSARDAPCSRVFAKPKSANFTIPES
jgi:hypothetical protein